MKKIKVLLLDIGGVLLTNGWGHEQRQQVLTHFGLDAKEFNPRHEQNFDTFELGKLSLDDYLYRTVFYEKRSFTPEEFKTSMFAQSQPLDGALAYFKQLKQKHNFRVIALSNEGRELNEYRIKTFHLNELFDVYISSSYVHLRKPDADIYKLAIDMTQTTIGEALYIEDRQTLVEIAQSFGITSLQYKDVASTEKYMKQAGF